MNEIALRQNHNLREEIQAYWSLRAETFDLQPGHEIFSEEERAAWHALLRKHLGQGAGRKALDLACGTAVVSHLLDDLGYSVTGMDWAEPMLERARKKAQERGRSIRFLMGDAEHTMEPDESYDVITNRHLVWTLVDPLACFREWHRVLKPGGKVLIIDGDFVNQSLIARLASRCAAWINSRRGAQDSRPQNGPAASQMETHRNILARVHFARGARAAEVEALLRIAGFNRITIDTNMRGIHKSQRANFSFLKRLERETQHRYAICAQKD